MADWFLGRQTAATPNDIGRVIQEWVEVNHLAKLGIFEWLNVHVGFRVTLRGIPLPWGEWWSGFIF